MKEENRSEIIHDALNFLDDEMIEDVEKLRGYVEKEELERISSGMKPVRFDENESQKMSFPKKNWRKWIALAASVCVLIAGSWIFENYIKPADDLEESNNGTYGSENWQATGNESNSDGAGHLYGDGIKGESDAEDAFSREEEESRSDTDETLYDLAQNHYPMQETQASPEAARTGVTIPEMTVSLKKGDELAGDMIGFFIHEGRSYVQYEYVRSGADFVGEYVRTVDGLLDEWTQEDGYVDGAGTFIGKIYEVEGVSPEFMLCTIWDDGVVETYINNNGITLTKGSDLVDDRLHLRDNFKMVSFQTDYEWSNTINEPILLEEEQYTLFDRFLDSFAENDFAYVEGKSDDPFGGDLENSQVYHLYFTTENGLVLRFSLLGDGYVCFPWLNSVCVQIEQDIYDDVIEVLEESAR